MANLDNSPAPIDVAAVTQALREAMDSSFFRNSERMRDFLAYVVNETLAGRGERIKSYSIAIEVFNRRPDFDASNDPIVRTTANRLRANLERFNASDECTQSIIIRLPKGRYVPVFEIRETAKQLAPAPISAAPSDTEADIARRSFPRRWVLPVALVAIAIVVGVVALQILQPQPEARFGRTLLLVSGTQTYERELGQLAMDLSPVLSGRLAAYGGVRVAENTLAPGASLDASYQLAPQDDVYSLDILLRGSLERLLVVWRLKDLQTNEVAWASETDLGGNSLVEDAADILVSRILGLDGALPTLLSMVYDETQDQRECLSKPQRLALLYHSELHADMQSCLEEMVLKQPNHAEAWGVLAQIYFRLARRAASFGEDTEHYSKLLDEAALKARMLAPQAYLTLHAGLYSTYSRGQLVAFNAIAEDMLDRYKDPHLKVRIGNAFTNIGQVDAGLELIRQGIAEMDEQHGLSYLPLAYEAYYDGHYQEALDILDRVAADDYYLVQLLRVVTHAKLGQQDLVQVALSALHQLRPGYENNLYADFRYNKVVEEDIESIADGLRAAGLTVHVPPGVAR